MNSLLYEIIVYILEALVSVVFMQTLLIPKYNKLLHIVLWCQITMVIMFITPSFTMVRIIVTAVAEFVFSLLMYENKFKRKLGVYFYKEALVLCSSAVAYLAYNLAIDKDADFFNICGTHDCTYCLMYLITLSVFISVAFQFTKETLSVECPWVIGTQLVIGVGEVLSILSVALSLGGTVNIVQSYLIIIACICMVAANTSVGILAPYLLKYINQIRNMDYGKQLSNMEYKYYEMAVENNRKMASVRHDISNHIQTVYSLFKSGNSDKAFDLIDELKSKYVTIDTIEYCNNPVVNIILSNKCTEAENQGIDVHIKCKPIDQLPVSDFDLSTVFCNLLDNAISGCIDSQQSAPKLIVEISEKNQYFVLRILNSCKVSLNIESTDRIETTKHNSSSHGIGMPIVAGIAKKYRGDFVVSAQNGIFTATVIMSIKGN